jgi:hypothetical protein
MYGRVDAFDVFAIDVAGEKLGVIHEDSNC